MTGHAEEWVQLPQHKVAVESTRGFACLVDQQGGTAPQTGTLDRSPEQDLSRRNGVGNQYTIICNNMMHEHGM